MHRIHKEKQSYIDFTSIGNLKVASILDELSVSFFPFESKFLELEPRKWKKQMIEFAPNLLFVESAWKGKYGLWYNKVCRPSIEFFELLDWCKENRVPTVFWNKEDPIHFTTFIEAAALFDYVFTTDLDCVPLYKRLLKHSRVGVLPFASPIKLFSPIEKYERKRAICFAGSYYDRQAERKADFINLVDELEKHWDIEIYDRNPYPDNPDYTYPKKYQKYIVGSLPVNQIDIAYKSYMFAITLNIVKHSSTMQARRAFELMSSNTIMLSNECKSLENLFGDLIIHMDPENKYIDRLTALTEDDVLLNKLRLAGLRKILMEHTYEERMRHIFRTVFKKEAQDESPSVCVYSKIKSQNEYDYVLQNWGRQAFKKKSLLLFTEDFDLPVEVMLPKGVVCLPVSSLIEKHLQELSPESHFALFDAGNYYGENYLNDILLSVKYENAPVIGKHSFYKHNDGLFELTNLKDKYILLDNMRIDRCVFARHLANSFSAEFLLTQDSVLSGMVCLSIDEFNFCEGYSADKCELVDDIEVNSGIKMERIYEIADIVQGDKYFEIKKRISGREIQKGIYKKFEHVKLEPMANDCMGIYSFKTHTRKYSKMKFSRLKLADFDTTKGLKVFYDADAVGNVRLEVRYYNQKDEQIDLKLSIPPKSYKVLPVPEDAVEFSLAICVLGIAYAVIKEICIDATPKGPIDLHDFDEVNHDS